jgi:single-strand DNA-binding protein
MLNLQVMGFVGKDAVVRNVGNQFAISFSIAHSEKFKDKNGVQQERTTWVNCTLWRENTTVAQYIRKGVRLWVEGTPSLHTYTDQQGRVGGSIELRVRSFEFAGEASASATKPHETPATHTAQPAAAEISADAGDDLPF